jgi:hypothetical protein
MTVVKRMVCLANSRKLGGSCVAGMEVAQGRRVGWIRPVTARESQELLQHDCLCDDGSCARPLDVVDVRLLRAQPSAYQQENWLLAPHARWRKVGRARWDDLLGLVDPAERLWIDGHSTKSGRNDRIPTEIAERLTSSLRLVHVTKLKLRVFQPGLDFGNPSKRLQAGFSHAGDYYWLRVTDPRYEETYLARGNGEYHVGESCLTISIGEPHTDGFCYKLVAAIIERKEAVGT